MTEMRRILCAAALGVAASATAQFHRFYTVDLTYDRLCVVDQLGAVTIVGPLGVNVRDVDLAWHQGTLFGVDTNTTQGLPVSKLYRINTTTGQATFSGTLKLKPSFFLTYPFIWCEALASDGVSLFAMWGLQPNTISPRFGRVSTTGVMGPSTLNTFDGDGMVYHPALATFLANNANPNFGITNELYAGNGLLSLVGINAPLNSDLINDLSMGHPAVPPTLWGINAYPTPGSNTLLQLDPTNNAILQRIVISGFSGGTPIGRLVGLEQAL